MAANLPQIITQIKANVGKMLSAQTITHVCDLLGYRFRQRTLDPVVIVHAFLLQILHGNVACSAVSKLIHLSFSASAYCNARAKLPLALLEALFERVASRLLPDMEQSPNWLGRRVWLLDGSTFSMPDTPVLQNHFGQPGAQKKGCGFPVAHLLALFHASTGILLKVVASPLRTHDMKHCAEMHPELQEKDILLADRGFASYAHLALLVTRKIDAVFRCHQRQIVDFGSGRPHTSGRKAVKGLPRSRWIKRLGKQDQLVEYAKPSVKPTWMSSDDYEQLPPTIIVRELRFQVTEKGRRAKEITLVTTLIDADAFPAKELAKLYEQRWQVELNLRHMKITMKMDVLHCKTVEGVMKELTMYALAYNLVRLVMLEGAKRQKAPVDRVSFIDVLRWLQTATPGTPLPRFVVNPKRSTRFEPRVKKRRPKQYDLMNKPRSEYRKAQLQQEVAG